MADHPCDDAVLVQRAKEMYERDAWRDRKIEVDQDAPVHREEDGAFVAGWLWVPNRKED